MTILAQDKRRGNVAALAIDSLTILTTGQPSVAPKREHNIRITCCRDGNNEAQVKRKKLRRPLGALSIMAQGFTTTIKTPFFLKVRNMTLKHAHLNDPKYRC